MFYAVYEPNKEGKIAYKLYFKELANAQAYIDKTLSNKPELDKDLFSFGFIL